MFVIDKVFEVDGKDVELITIKNKSNIEVKLLNYGAAIVELLVPDRNHIVENVVLTYQNLEDYTVNAPYFGATLGRTSGRIAEGKFCLDEQLYTLNINFGVNHCHGGIRGYSHQIWSYEVLETDQETAVEFSYESYDGEENYPGQLRVKVLYTLLENNMLAIEYKAETDKKTLCNLTNHSYFNLSGNYKRGITDQFIKIASASFLELDNNFIPTGKLIDVKGTPMDFNKRKLVGKDINSHYEQLKIANGYDHPWLLEGSANQVEMYDAESGRKMTISTTYPAVVVYSFNFPDSERLKSGKTAQKHDGICFETQYEPNGINTEGLNKSILQPGESYYERTEYKFSIE
jgi:aldose 1-epimerase